jgi:hypothetical protein
MRIKFLKADHGDCIIISINKFNILIDGGPPSCYYDSNLNMDGELKSELDAIKTRLERIDLLILTHIDNDHIGGLLKWFEMDGDAYAIISQIWFNSGRTLAKAFDELANTDLKVHIDNEQSALTGVTEGVEFEDYVFAKKIWDEKIWISGMKFNHADFNIELISPGRGQLGKLVKEYRKKLPDLKTGAEKSDWRFDLELFIHEESRKDFKFKEDTSVKNGSSIALVLSVEEKRFLFLGDAHPSIIENGLTSLGYSKENPLRAELVKLSHHGSHKNTSKSLLDLIESDKFLLSTNGDHHCHPSKRTLARILTRNPSASFFFNYEEMKDRMFTTNDKRDYVIKAMCKNEFFF